MTQFGGISGEELRQYIERIERLEEEKKSIAEQVSDVYKGAKNRGFDPKIMRQIIKLRKMEDAEQQEQDFLLDTYKAALGMIPEFEAAEEANKAISSPAASSYDAVAEDETVIPGVDESAPSEAEIAEEREDELVA